MALADKDDFLNKRNIQEAGKMNSADATQFKKDLKEIVDALGAGNAKAREYQKALTAVNQQLSTYADLSQDSGQKFSGLLSSAFGSMDKGAAQAGKLSDGILKAVFNFDKASGTMSILGKATNMTADAFKDMLGNANLVAKIGMAYLNFIVSAQQQEAALIKAAGSTAGGTIDVGTAKELQARGERIAGTPGQEAELAIRSSLSSARKRLLEFMSPVEQDRLAKIHATDTAIAPLIQTLAKLNVGSLTKGGPASLVTMITELSMVSKATSTPVEELSALLSGLGDQFVAAGGSMEDLSKYAQAVAGAVGSGTMTTKMAMTAANTTFQQGTTASGMEMNAKASVFLLQNWKNISTEAKDVLNRAARAGSISSAHPQGLEFIQLSKTAQFQAIADAKKNDNANYNTLVLPQLEKTVADRFGGKGQNDLERRFLTTQIMPELTGFEDAILRAFVKALEEGNAQMRAQYKLTSAELTSPANIKNFMPAYEAYQTDVGSMMKGIGSDFKASYYDFFASAQRTLTPEVLGQNTNEINNPIPNTPENIGVPGRRMNTATGEITSSNTVATAPPGYSVKISVEKDLPSATPTKIGGVQPPVNKFTGQ